MSFLGKLFGKKEKESKKGGGGSKKGKGGGKGGEVITLTDSNFDELVLQSEDVWMVI